jgi:hypothetical protein
MLNLILVVLTQLDTVLKIEPNLRAFAHFNENEFIIKCLILLDILNNGNKVIIDPLCEDWDSILLFFYSNCIASYFISKEFVFHVSGVLDKTMGFVLLHLLEQEINHPLKLKEKDIRYLQTILR